jgi:hypothetical protein
VSLGSFQQPAELRCREEQSQESHADDFKAEHCFSPVRLLVFLGREHRRRGSNGCVHRHKKAEW